VGIFLVGLSEGFARSLARYVSSDPRVVLTGVAPSVAIASIMLPRIDPDVALLDWAALNGVARDAMQLLRAGCPGVRIACVVSEGETYRAAAAQAGADAVISEEGFAGELESLLRGFFPDRFGASAGRHE
jgi:DNA-binding NarL/FixJ family response regulator